MAGEGKNSNFGQPYRRGLSRQQKAEAMVETGLADNLDEACEQLEDMGELEDDGDAEDD